MKHVDRYEHRPNCGQARQCPGQSDCLTLAWMLMKQAPGPLIPSQRDRRGEQTKERCPGFLVIPTDFATPREVSEGAPHA